jgi:hypothetical protein
MGESRLYLGELPMKRPVSRKIPTTFSGSLKRHWAAYAAAAGASLGALSSSSEAEIVYTPADETINLTVGTYGLDLNHDGIVDFTIADHRTFSNGHGFPISRQSLFVKPAYSQNRINCVNASCLSTYIYAAALPQGSLIGPSRRRHGWLAGHAQMALEERLGGRPYYFGSFNRVQNEYLGLQFHVNGETYYGWARFTVRFHGGSTQERSWEATLTGYAYESTPNQAIKAGQTKDGDEPDNGKDTVSQTAPLAEIPATHPTLGALALGSDGMQLWRKNQIAK